MRAATEQLTITEYFRVFYLWRDLFCILGSGSLLVQRCQAGFVLTGLSNLWAVAGQYWNRNAMA